MTSGTVRLERHGAVGILSLDNPPLNVITAAVRTAFMGAVEEIRGDSALRALILTGEGEAFCAGADLREEQRLDRDTVRPFLKADRAVYAAMQELPIPVLAAVHGPCMGGGFELALACDLRIASSTARFRGSGVRLGLITSTARLTKMFGSAVAKNVLLTGRTFDGEEAYRLGIVSAVTESSELHDESMKWARMIASRAPLAVSRTKAAIDSATDLKLDEALAEELDHFAELIETKDHKAALNAFFNREDPEFRGH